MYGIRSIDHYVSRVVPSQNKLISLSLSLAGERPGHEANALVITDPLGSSVLMARERATEFRVTVVIIVFNHFKKIWTMYPAVLIIASHFHIVLCMGRR